jgi:hypothetical protein
MDVFALAVTFQNNRLGQVATVRDRLVACRDHGWLRAATLETRCDSSDYNADFLALSISSSV